MAATEEKLRNLANAFGYIVFAVAIYVGCALFFGDPQRLQGSSWIWVWEMPGQMYTWSTIPVIAGLCGIVGIKSKRYPLAMLSGLACSGWSFVLGIFLLVAVFTEPHANLLWFPLFWFLSASYSLLTLSFTEEYL